MLSDRLGLSASVRALFVHFTERWDGKGVVEQREGRRDPAAGADRARGPDTAFQRMLGGDEFAARVVRERAGGAFDPAIANTARRRRRRDPCARARRLGLGGRARVRAEPSRDAGGRGDRPRPGGDGELRRSRVSVPGRPLGGSRRAGDSGRAAVPSRRSRRRHRSPKRVRPRRGPRRRAGAHLAEARAADAGRVGAGQAPCLSHRARPQPLAVPRDARARSRPLTTSDSTARATTGERRPPR